MYCVLCLSSIFPECRVKRQSNPSWLDHNHMWPALVWSLSIGSSFMSMSTAFKKLQASNCKVCKVRPFLTKNSPVCKVPAQHKKWVSVLGSVCIKCIKCWRCQDMIYIHSARNTSHHNQARLVPAPPQQRQLSHSLLSPQMLPLASTGEALG